MAIETLGTVTQSEVARRVGMSRDAFNRSVNGQRTFAPVELGRISRTLGVSLHWLVTGDPQPALAPGDSIPDPVTATVAYPAAAYRQVRLVPPWTLNTSTSMRSAPAEAAASARSLAVAAAGERFIEDLPAALAAAFGLDIFILQGGPEFDARAVHLDHSAYVAVRGTGMWFAANYALARELGHLLHGEFPPIDARTSATRGWADDFADHFLVPDDLLGPAIGEADTAALGALLWDTGVSAEVLRRRIAAVAPGSRAEAALGWHTTLALVANHIEGFSGQSRANVYRGIRVPQKLLEAQLEAVGRGEADGHVLAWMLDVPLEELAPRPGIRGGRA
ncbi:hypothetical protein NCCP1664_13020 [Zafaria cholistanensis]|uniref:HTH cro/C1-type domain-containing protein n=2 Tax=Zafaria cholistanensis TaxID=1682741 RepID=A0A5A7NPY4_9MICC|nr:hypothetical protein NCCP1664_13020 [Zafaria cholistanensis]